MHADLSRDTFRPDRHYAAVLAQQGRVQLDADANEQAAIQLHRARTTTADLIGQHGGPLGATGFEVGFLGGSRELDDLSLGGGRYYVDGILLDATRPEPGVPADEDAADDTETPATWTYWDQPDGHRDPERPGDRLPTQFPYLACLKVWERSVTAAEDPLLREVALGPAMPDTAARIRTVWQVLPLPGTQLELEDGATKDQVREAFARWTAAQAPTARMAARGERPEHADDAPCLVEPDARYRGPENQMYRVEIHQGGPAKDATFKWSRENGSVTLPVDGLDGTWVELASLGNDDKLGLDVGDQVEFVDTGYTSRGEPLPLLRVEEIDLPGRRVRLSDEPHPRSGDARNSTRSCGAGTSGPDPGTRAERAVRGSPRRSCGAGRSGSRRAAGCRWRTAYSCTSSRAGPTGPVTTGPSRPAPRRAVSSGRRTPPAARSCGPRRASGSTTHRWPGCWGRDPSRICA